MAGLAAGAGVIHFAMVPVHAGSGLLDPIAFALIGWFQVVLAALLIARASFSRPLCLAAIYGNGAVLGIWAWSRTTGLPIGSSNGQVESIEAIDLIASLFEAAVVLLALVVIYAPRRFEIPQLGAVVVGISALALATSVIVQPEAAAHGHGENSVASAGHHGTTADPALVASIEKDRCDVEFNPKGYWKETAMLGIDTHAGGAMDMSGMSSLNVAAQDGGTSPLGGRGSERLDEIVSFSSAANGSEAAEARLVVALAGATDAEYGEWLRWMAKNGGGHTAHGSGTAAAPDDTQGHGGHVGPQTWTALVDEDACARLADELAISRKTALQYPTAADAVRAGWRKVTGYVPGIAAHYMNFKLVDGTFKIDEPEMILYDGDGDDAKVVGLSYYLVHDGDAEPTQGFTGDNDHYHRHIGLCVNKGESLPTPQRPRASAPNSAVGSNKVGKAG